MTDTNSRAKHLTFAINYGFASGPVHSKKLRKLAAQAGFKPAPITKADIVIAHSAGCWLLPSDIRPKLIIYVGMPLATGRAQHIWLRANLASFKEGNTRHNLSTRVKNTYYGLRQPRRNLRIVREAKHKIGHPTLFSNVLAVFIANRRDLWPKSDTRQAALLAEQQWAFISLPGNHDDIWEKPERYVAIMEHYGKILAQTDR